MLISAENTDWLVDLQEMHDMVGSSLSAQLHCRHTKSCSVTESGQKLVRPSDGTPDLSTLGLPRQPRAASHLRPRAAVEVSSYRSADQLRVHGNDYSAGRIQIWMTRQAQLLELQKRYSLLTAREREILVLAVSGVLNKHCGEDRSQRDYRQGSP